MRDRKDKIRREISKLQGEINIFASKLKEVEKPSIRETRNCLRDLKHDWQQIKEQLEKVVAITLCRKEDL